jgi:integrase
MYVGAIPAFRSLDGAIAAFYSYQAVLAANTSLGWDEMERQAGTRSSSPRLLARVRNAARMRHLSERSEEVYVGWIRRYVHFHGKRDPAELGVPEFRAFLSHVTVQRKVAASTQNQAYSAVRFLNLKVLDVKLPPIENVRSARRPRRLPVVLTMEETRRVLAELKGVHSLVGGLLYGSGLRLHEALRLRVKDLDFEERVLTVREPKGGADPVGILPETLIPRLQTHLIFERHLHTKDDQAGFGETILPGPLDPSERDYAVENGWFAPRFAGSIAARK